ncbi:MAG: hypothetical protein O2856_00820 [Planctomycetota bacterium]|nr:hypothetical protein [Planctomycetota bacterium]
MTIRPTTSMLRAARAVLVVLMLLPMDSSACCCCSAMAGEIFAHATCQSPCDCCCSLTEEQTPALCCLANENAAADKCPAGCSEDCECGVVTPASPPFLSRTSAPELQGKCWLGFIGHEAALISMATLTDFGHYKLSVRDMASHNHRQARLCVWQN